MSKINVTNEIKKLKTVLLHRPGKELLNLTPATLEELLFDDIPYLKRAQEEHDEFARVLSENGTNVVYLEDLMTETLDSNEGLRQKFLDQFIKEAGVTSHKFHKIVFNYLNNIKDTKELVLKTMEGVTLSELKTSKKETLVDMINKDIKLIIKPMPNLYFTRDPFATVGNGIILNRMYSETRNRETIFADYIFKYHPEYKDKVELLYHRDYPFHIEGGDVLNLSEKILAIGISQRTEPAAIDLLANNIFFNSNSKIEKILAFDIPSIRAFMHLDTVFTQVDKNKFTVHPEILSTLKVYEFTKDEENNDINVRLIEDKFEKILSEQLERDVELLPCGAGSHMAASREQWNDGSNTLAVSPGKVIVYERNDITNPYLRKNGLKTLEISGSELVRGRGGPRCMSMPLEREE